MVQIVVWLKQDYSESGVFYMPFPVTKKEVTEEVNKRFEEWYFYDIWNPGQYEED